MGRFGPDIGQSCELSQRQFARILLIKPSSLGDIIHALPVLAGLRQRYPQAHIAWLASSSYVSLLEAQPAVDEVIAFDRRLYGRLGRSPRATAGFVAFVRELRRRRFELVIDLQGLFRSGFLSKASGAEVRIGFGDARELGWVFYTHRMAVGAGDPHAVDKNYLVAELLGFSGRQKDFALHVPPDVQQRTTTVIREAGLEYGSYAVLVPAGRWETKCWPAERFAKLADMIADRLGLRVVLLGTESESGVCRQVQQGASAKLVNLAGRSDLLQLVAVIKGAKLVITNDSGPMHVAAALDRPVVAPFGPTNPVRTGPYSARARVVREPMPCSPCYLRRMDQCAYQHRCLRQISAERIFAAAAELLADPQPTQEAQAAG